MPMLDDDAILQATSRRTLMQGTVAAAAALAAGSALGNRITPGAAAAVAEVHAVPDTATTEVAVATDDQGAAGANTAAINATLQAVSAVRLVAPPGVVYIDAPLSVPPKTHFDLGGATIAPVDDANLPALIASENWLNGGRFTTSGPVIYNGRLEGRKADQSGVTHGIALTTFRALVYQVGISEVSGSGILLATTTLGGTGKLDNSGVENRIVECDVIRPDLHCVHVEDGDPGTFTDGYMLYNIFVGASQATVRHDRVAGWYIIGNHAYLCQNHAFDLRNVWGSYIAFNETNNFGLDDSIPGRCFGMSFDLLSAHEGQPPPRPVVVLGNGVSNREASAPQNDFVYYRFRNQPGVRETNVMFDNNYAHQNTAGAAYSKFVEYVPRDAAMNIWEGQNMTNGPDPEPIIRSGVLHRHASLTDPADLSPGGPYDPISAAGASPAGAVETMDRRSTTAEASALVADGSVWLTFFTPPADVTVSAIITASRTPTQAGARLCRAGIYAVDDDGGLTLLARTPNDATLWAAAATTYESPLEADPGFPPTVALRRCSRYALGVLVDGCTREPRLLGHEGVAGVACLDPRTAASVPGRTDLPTTIAPGDLVDTGIEIYARLK